MAGEWRQDPKAAHQLRYHDGNGWTDHISDNGVIGVDPFDQPRHPPPSGPSTAPQDEDAEAIKGRKLVIAGLVTSGVSLLLCPCIGSMAGGGLALAGQRTTPVGRRSALGRLPLATYLLSGLGLLGWIVIFAIAAATGEAEEPEVAATATTMTTEVSVPVTTTSAPAVTVVVPTGDAELLAAVRVEPEVDPGGYDRGLFNYPAGGTDSRGCNTRSRVLERDSTVPAQITFPNCQVLVGRWLDSYTGTAYERASDVSIDHLVALKQAYVSGASAWSPATRTAFANDIDRLGALRVIGGSGNASKGDKDPAAWKPPLQQAWADYARSWLGVKIAYGLSADPAEVNALRTMLTPPPPVTTPPSTVQTPVTPPPTAAPTTKAPVTTRPPITTPATTGVYYANCAEARAAGAAPIRRGEPGYRSALDRDRIICTR